MQQRDPASAQVLELPDRPGVPRAGDDDQRRAGQRPAVR